MGVISPGGDQAYGIAKGLMYSFPVTCEGGKWQIVQGLPIDERSRALMDATAKELAEEKAKTPEKLRALAKDPLQAREKPGTPPRAGETLSPAAPGDAANASAASSPASPGGDDGDTRLRGCCSRRLPRVHDLSVRRRLRHGRLRVVYR